MGKVHCKGCAEEVRDEDVFLHQRQQFCPDCAVKHIREEHAAEFKRLRTHT